MTEEDVVRALEKNLKTEALYSFNPIKNMTQAWALWEKIEDY